MSLLKTNEIQNYNGSSLTLTASTVSTSAQLNTGGNISVTGSLNVSDDSTTRTNLGLGTMATQNANAVAITGGTINTIQPATGQSLTIKDEDGNTAITIGTDNTAASYLSLNFGSHTSGTGSLTSSTLSDYEEGTFLPTVSSTSGTITTVSANGFYRKIGTTVICFIDFTVTTNGTGAGLATISGLPFSTTASSESSGAMRIDGFNGRTAAYTLDKSSTSIVLSKYDNTYPFGNNARGTLVVPYIVA
jgi:hypothetical protein